jgi:peroxiredoxin
VRIIAISVDPLDVAKRFAKDLSLPFPLASDPELAVIRAWGLENEEVGDLAWHAVYIVDTDQRIFYRKAGGLRPRAQELLDAIDFHFQQGAWAPPDAHQ